MTAPKDRISVTDLHELYPHVSRRSLSRFVRRKKLEGELVVWTICNALNSKRFVNLTEFKRLSGTHLDEPDDDNVMAAPGAGAYTRRVARVA